MLRRPTLLVLLLPATVHAGASIELIPEQSGPYFGGETVEVGVFATSDLDHRLRVLQLDFSASNSALLLGDRFAFDYRGSDGVVVSMQIYYELSELHDEDGAVVAATYPLDVDLGPNFLIDLVPGVQVHLGDLDVTLPGAAGVYTLDAMNASEPDPAVGAMFEYDFDTPTTWRAYSGELTGGTYDFVIVPEPASCLLLSAAAFALRRRGKCIHSKGGKPCVLSRQCWHCVSGPPPSRTP